MEVARPALRHNIDDAAARPAKLGVVSVTDDLHLLNGIGGGRYQQPAPVSGCVRRAVHQDGAAHRPPTIQAEGAEVLIHGGVQLTHDPVCGRRLGQYQRERIVNRRRELGDHRRGQSRGLVRGPRVEQRRLADHFDALRFLPNLHHDVQARGVVRQKGDRPLRQGPEAARFRRQLIGSGQDL